MTSAPWQNRIVGHADVAPAELVPNPRNWRSHPPEQQRALSGALAEVGWVGEVLVNRTTGRVVDGHLRIELALARNEPSVPVTYVELSEEEERIVLATLDPIGAMAEAESAALAELLAGLEPADAALRALLDDLARQHEVEVIRGGLVDPDEVPELPDEPSVRPGELYSLGDHRLLVGDSTSTADVERLVAGETARAMVTDPPWNVALGQDANPRHRQRPGLVNDDLPAAEFAAFLRSFAVIARAVVSGDIYCVLGAAEWPTLDLALREAGFHWSATIIWVKQQFVLGRSNFHRRYEPLWYGWRAGEASSYTGDRTADDVWEINRPSRSPDHPTTKPVEIYTRAIGHSTVRGDLVYEPFAGSGTALIASEQTGRRCAAMEIDPRYAQVAIRRWEAFSGQRAELVDAE
jgi:DNA modification methylase